MSKRSSSRQFSAYLTIKQAAELLGVSPSTLRNWDRAKKLTPWRHPINGYRLYRREELEALLDPRESSKPRGPHR